MNAKNRVVAALRRCQEVAMSAQNHGLQTSRSVRLRLIVSTILFIIVLSSRALTQTVVATIPARGTAVAANPVTNKIYAIGGGCGVKFQPPPGTVTVIDGSTYTTTTITAGICPKAIVVNPVTNIIYVVNVGFESVIGGPSNSGGITVIDGATNAMSFVADPNARYPIAIAVNSATNKIYVANAGTGNITVIDGDTNSTTTVTVPNAGPSSYAVAVNQATNNIYVTDCENGSVTVINGATNATTTVSDPNAICPGAVAVNSSTNQIYVANGRSNNVTIIDGATNSTTTVTDPNAVAPQAVAVNQITNTIYVANLNDTASSENGGVTVIDGVTNAVSNVRDPNAIAPWALAVNQTTNQIYVANEGSVAFEYDGNIPSYIPGSITVIDGATDTPLTVIDPNAKEPSAVAVNETTNNAYVMNQGSDNVSVIAGGSTPTTHLLWILLAGGGSGTITSNPSGINCGTNCSASFTTGTTVSLTESVLSGYFSGWSSACTGVGACNITMNGDNFVTATFNADFSITPASAALTLQSGSQGTDVITLVGINGPFDNAIQLTCSVAGPAPLPTCGFSAASVTPGASSATSTLTVTAPTAAALQIPADASHLMKSFCALWLPLMFGLTAIGGLKKRRPVLRISGGSLALLLFLQMGCAANGSTTPPPPPPPPMNYAVTVTASSGAIQHSTQVTATVQ